MKPRTLFREEEAELACCNKKVKDIHHAKFNGAVREGSPPIDNCRPEPQTKASFNDKLIGELPGAYAEAFDLTGQLEEDIEAEEKIVDNSDLVGLGRVAIKLSKETIIIKLVGRTVGFNFLQSKLLQLWRLTGRMDCVDLTYSFFLVRFYSDEDLDHVIQKGLWFIEEHFLSLRPWEPFFKPSTTNVSLIVVWIRLNELPFELYEIEVLKQIGDSIGKVLRVDS